MTHASLLVAVVVFVVCAPAAYAKNYSWYVLPSLYQADSDSSRRSDADHGLQVTVGWAFAPRWNLELVTESTKFVSDGGLGTLKQTGLAVQTTYDLFPELRVGPILLGGLGSLHNQFPARSENNLTARAGLGLRWNAQTIPVGLRLDVVWRHEFNTQSDPEHTHYTDEIYSLGLAYRFGATRPEAAADIKSLPPPLESGRRPGSSPTATSSQPAATPSQQPPARPDLDADKIPDDQDRCPDTPLNATVDVDGCLIRLNSRQ